MSLRDLLLGKSDIQQSTEAYQALQAYDADNPTVPAIQCTPSSNSNTIASVNGVICNTASYEYALWYAEHYSTRGLED